MFSGIDLYSDTVTRPSQAMRNAMAQAEVGNEQEGEDPTTLKLEAKISDLLGFPASLSFPSATMANEVALRIHCEPGDELIAAENCHLFIAETGGPAVNAQALARPISTDTGVFTADDVVKKYRSGEGFHGPKSAVVSVENTTNMGGGVPWPVETLTSVLQTAKELRLRTHLDGARLFHAALATGVDVRQIASPFDTVTVCLSKGLGCPVGAILAFPQEHFRKIRRLKQQMGGAMRQSGILTAAALFALDNNVNRLQEDHKNASRLARGLAQEEKHLIVENPCPSTNMVFFQWENDSISPEQFDLRCQKDGVRFSRVGHKRFRAVTHIDVNSKDIEKAIAIVKNICSEI